MPGAGACTHCLAAGNQGRQRALSLGSKLMLQAPEQGLGSPCGPGGRERGQGQDRTWNHCPGPRAKPWVVTSAGRYLQPSASDDPDSVHVYDLMATVVHILDSRTGGSLVGHIKVGETYHQRKEVSHQTQGGGGGCAGQCAV